MNDLSMHAYQGHTAVTNILIAGEDITYLQEGVLSIREISFSLDYPLLTQYQPSECEITLFDPKGLFSSNNSNNFFIQNDYHMSGHRVPIEIHAGYLVDGNEITNQLFKGLITKITQPRADGTTLLIANDSMADLFFDEVTDFGIQRGFKLELENVQDVHGNYPVPDVALPISEDSVTVRKSLNEEYNEVDGFSETGIFNPDNFIVGNKGITSEYLDLPDAAAGYPRFSGKTAYRDRHVKTVVEDILEHLGYTDTDIDIPDYEVGNHLSRIERVGTRIIGSPDHGEDPAEVLTWKGYPTDAVHDNGFNYILYNSPPVKDGETKYDSLVIRENVTTGEETVLYRTQAELWGIAKEGNNIALLCTDSLLVDPEPLDYFMPDQVTKPDLGSYDCTQGTNKTFIRVLQEDAGTTILLVHKTSVLKAQIGYNYIFGATLPERVGPGYQIQKINDIVPDSIRSFEIYNGHLYYFYGMSNTEKTHGVAKVAITGGTPTALLSLPSDGRSHLGGNFIIRGGTGYYLGTAWQNNYMSDISIQSLSL